MDVIYLRYTFRPYKIEFFFLGVVNSNNNKQQTVTYNPKPK